MKTTSSESTDSLPSAHLSSLTTQRYLFALKNTGSRYGIERMLRFAEALGQPQQQFPSIHVAGTNGKGSVCAMLEALYRSNGYTAGLFSSPHLVHLGERIQINRQILPDFEIDNYVEQLRPIAAQLGKDDEALHPTFFEFMAAMAFLRFAQAKVDIALIETGLGGRLDATNILDPELSIITSISLDHTEMLGDTLEQIATEKAGILKPGKPALIGKLPPEAEKTIRAIAAERGCKVYSVLERFSNFQDLPQTNLAGSFQRWNAGLAYYATEILAEQFPVQTHDALTQVDWAGRWQQIEVSGKTLILDATHNPEGASMLDENLNQLANKSGTKPIVIAGTLGEERGRSLMQTVAKHAREIHLLSPDQDRALTTDQLADLIPSNFDGPIFKDTINTLFPKPETCTVGQTGDTIVITGSLYLIGEVLQHLQGASNENLQDKI